METKLETKHYLSFLQATMHRRWDNLALADFDGTSRYNYSDLAREIERLHITFEKLGVMLLLCPVWLFFFASVFSHLSD